MLVLLCGKDPMELGMKSCEGWNITVFLDHLRSCEKCSKSQDVLINRLNGIIGCEDRGEDL